MVFKKSLSKIIAVSLLTCVLFTGCKDKEPEVVSKPEPTVVETVEEPVPEETMDVAVKINDLSIGDTLYERLSNVIRSKDYSASVVSDSSGIRMGYDIVSRSSTNIVTLTNLHYIDKSLVVGEKPVETRYINKAFEVMTISTGHSNGKDWVCVADKMNRQYWISDSISSEKFGELFGIIFGDDVYPEETELAKNLFTQCVKDASNSDVLYYRTLEDLGWESIYDAVDTYDEVYVWDKAGSNKSHMASINIEDNNTWRFTRRKISGRVVVKTFEFKDISPDDSYKSYREHILKPTWDETPDQP